MLVRVRDLLIEGSKFTHRKACFLFQFLLYFLPFLWIPTVNDHLSTAGQKFSGCRLPGTVRRASDENNWACHKGIFLERGMKLSDIEVFGRDDQNSNDYFTVALP